jgi:branched-chain amino acid aminotransferase
VERIGYEGKDIKVPTGENGQGIGDLAKSFLTEVQGRQIGKIPSKWSVVVSE